MLKLKTLIACVAVAMASTMANAQTCEQQECKETKCEKKECIPAKYYFVQASAGASTLYNGGSDFFNSISPTYGISAGAMFTPVVGARVNVTGYASKNELQSIKKHYWFNYINTNIDVMINIYRLIAKEPKAHFNAFFVAGAGLNCAWNNDEFVDLNKNFTGAITENTNGGWGFDNTHKSLCSGTLRAGIILDFPINKNWSVDWETNVSHVSDKLNSQICGDSDWMLTTQFAVSYKFPFKSCKK